MNKRQKKKFQKKLGCKTYDQYYRRVLFKSIDESDLKGENNIIYVITSKKGGLKPNRIRKIYLLKDYRAITMRTEPETVKLDLSCANTIQEDIDNKYMDILNSYPDWIKNQSYIKKIMEEENETWN